MEGHRREVSTQVGGVVKGCKATNGGTHIDLFENASLLLAWLVTGQANKNVFLLAPLQSKLHILNA